MFDWNSLSKEFREESTEMRCARRTSVYNLWFFPLQDTDKTIWGSYSEKSQAINGPTLAVWAADNSAPTPGRGGRELIPPEILYSKNFNQTSTIPRGKSRLISEFFFAKRISEWTNWDFEATGKSTPTFRPRHPLGRCQQCPVQACYKTGRTSSRWTIQPSGEYLLLVPL